MKDVVVYTVVPKLPPRLSVLEEMAKNLWFSWNLEAIDLFRSIDQNLCRPSTLIRQQWRRQETPTVGNRESERPGLLESRR
jgi:hypothetical protein